VRARSSPSADSPSRLRLSCRSPSSSRRQARRR